MSNILVPNDRKIVVCSPFPSILYKVSLSFFKILLIISSKIWHFEVSAVQNCKGLRQIKNYSKSIQALTPFWLPIPEVPVTVALASCN